MPDPCRCCHEPAQPPYARAWRVGWLHDACVDRVLSELAHLGPVARAVLADNGATTCAGVREVLPFQPEEATLRRLTDE